MEVEFNHLSHADLGVQVLRKMSNAGCEIFSATNSGRADIGRDEEVIRAYIRNQELADQQLDQLELKTSAAPKSDKPSQDPLRPPLAVPNQTSSFAGGYWHTHRGSPDVAEWSAYPSMAVISISLPDKREGQIRNWPPYLILSVRRRARADYDALLAYARCMTISNCSKSREECPCFVHS